MLHCLNLSFSSPDEEWKIEQAKQRISVASASRHTISPLCSSEMSGPLSKGYIRARGSLL
ncbi:hypothetical protein DAI22_04g091500 [Oryza sativa Japonica Group]|nr:hypothetical protein DAI22_04g091500 [Oryza sativa Japonica Group]